MAWILNRNGSSNGIGVAWLYDDFKCHTKGIFKIGTPQSILSIYRSKKCNEKYPTQMNQMKCMDGSCYYSPILFITENNKLT